MAAPSLGHALSDGGPSTPERGKMQVIGLPTRWGAMASACASMVTRAEVCSLRRTGGVKAGQMRGLGLEFGGGTVGGRQMPRRRVAQPVKRPAAAVRVQGSVGGLEQVLRPRGGQPPPAG